MIKNQKCENCSIAAICTARAKLKPFSDEARTDLGVTIVFEECENYVSEDEIDEDSGTDAEDE